MKLEVWAEIKPSPNRGKIVETARAIKDFVDYIDVPEAPMGIPKAHSIAVAAVIRYEVGVKCIANIRLLDINTNGLISLAGAALLLGLEGIVLLRGDPPAYGKPVMDIGTEDAIRILKSNRRLKELRIGAILSLARDYHKRLEIPADFFLVTRLWKPSQLENEAIRSFRLKGGKIIPYIVVAEKDEKKHLYLLLKGHQPVFEPAEAAEFTRKLVGLVDGVLVSAPLSSKTLVEAVKAVRDLNRQ